jgi:superfamily II DNA or RNA helicase
LILATPKTDIIQAVGRILRVKHDRPLVVDIIDSHEVFLRQWQKRKKYYQSNNYTIMHTKSPLYAAKKWTKILPLAGTKRAGAGTTNKNKNTSPSCAADQNVAAIAKFINTTQRNTYEVGADANEVGADEDEVDEDEDEDETPLQKGRCLLLNLKF